jgi:hypothetical protein
MPAKCHLVNFVGYWNWGDCSDAQIYFAEHPELEHGGLCAGVYHPKGYRFGKSIWVHGSLLEAVACPYCHKHLSDCRCDYT